MPDGDLFLPHLENGFAAGPDQYSASDIVIGRIGANISAGATGSGVTGSQAWINSVLANTPSYSFAGVIHEVIVFDHKLDDAERDRVYSYLSRKYGATLEASLPKRLTSAHTPEFVHGISYWNIENHPNSLSLSTIPVGITFGDITLSNFLDLPSQVYKSAGTRLSDGTILVSDTYTIL